MKKFNHLVLGLIVLAVGVLSSCGKDDEPSVSKAEMLAGKTSKQWVAHDASLGGVTVPIEDCDKDDVATFSVNKDYSYTYGSNKCESSDSDYNGTWAFSSDEKTITIPSGSISLVYTIKELSNSTLKLETSLFGVSTVITYKAK